MNGLPDDINKKVESFFVDLDDRQKVKELLISLWKMPLNVGPDQLARSILVLAEDDIDLLKGIFEDQFEGDPRDIILTAESKIGYPGHYFIPTFEEIDKGLSFE